MEDLRGHYDFRRRKGILFGYLIHMHTDMRVEKINIGNGYHPITPKMYACCCCSSVTQLCPTLCLYGLWHARLPCQSPSSEVCSNSYPLNQWCHPTISSSVIPFFSCLQSFPASGSCPMSRLFTSGGQIIGASASASVLPMNIQGWFPLGLTGFISLLSKGLSRVFSNTTVQKH